LIGKNQIFNGKEVTLIFREGKRGQKRIEPARRRRSKANEIRVGEFLRSLESEWD
jgi:hypothetical protein